MKALVTGSKGFIGSALFGSLMRLGWDVFGFDLPQDISDYDCVRKIFKETQPDIVFHLAAITTVSEAAAFPVRAFEVNTLGTVYVLDAAVEHKCRKAIVASTYMHGTDAYSKSKECAELACKTYEAKALKVGIMVHGNVYGPGDRNMERLIPCTIQNVLNGIAPTIRSNPLKSFVYIDDIVNAYIKMAKTENLFEAVFTRRHRVKSVVELIIQKMGSELHPIINLFGEDDCHNLEQTPITRGATCLGDGLTETIEWYTEHRKEFGC